MLLFAPQLFTEKLCWEEEQEDLILHLLVNFYLNFSSGYLNISVHNYIYFGILLVYSGKVVFYA